MVNIQVNDPYTGEPISYEVNSDDRQVLVNLLHEYADKLQDISEQLAKLNKINKLYFIFTIVISLFGTSLIMYDSFLKRWFARVTEGEIPLYLLDATYKITIYFSGVVLIAMILYIFIGRYFFANKITILDIHTHQRTARVIDGKLEKVMQVTIEIQDRIETNLARKLELDLRIADAQSALEYYYSIVEKK
jgi:hypothetical protein